MKSILANLKIVVPEKIFIKDPESSTLGKRIVQNSILLIDEIGFDSFTFKKLGEKIGSNEALYIDILKVNINYCYTCHHGIGLGLNINWFLKHIVFLITN